MAANVLNNEQAIRASVEVVRAFVKLSQIVASNAELARKVDALEQSYDTQFKVVFKAIRELMNPPLRKKNHIGFRV